MPERACQGGIMRFCEYLRYLRESRGLKQKDVAEKIDIGVHTYQRYEYGEREPQLSTLVALADFYDLSLDELACRERKRNTRN